MSWLIFKTSLSKIWIWIKEHWQIPFLFAWSILVWVIARRNSDAIIETLEARKESYKKQIQVLRDSHNMEILKREGLIKQYEEALEKVEKNFAEKEKELSDKHKADIKEAIILSKGNPDEIRKRIEKEFGIKYVE